MWNVRDDIKSFALMYDLVFHYLNVYLYFTYKKSYDKLITHKFGVFKFNTYVQRS